MLSLPFNSSTPVLWVNRDMLQEAGIDPDTDLSTWQNVGGVLDQLKEAGVECPLTTAWQSWIHLENLSAYHDVPFATKDNGFAGLDTELAFNGEAQVATFAGQGGELDLNEAGAFSTDTRVKLKEPPTASTETPGLWPVTPGAMDLVWRLPKTYAQIFSDEVANLAQSSEPAGSTTLECDVLGEIRVKVSIGEWEEDYLTDDFR